MCLKTSLEIENCSVGLVLKRAWLHGRGLGLGVELLVLAVCKSSGVPVNQEEVENSTINGIAPAAVS